MTRLARVVSIALTAAVTALPAAAFDASDLEGGWYASSIEATTATNAPLLRDLHLTVAADGTTSGTSYTYADSAPVQANPITGGSLSINAYGRVNGTLELPEGVEIDVVEFQMNLGKDLISGVGAPAPTFSSFFTLVKAGTSYTNSDLEGSWWLSGFYEDITSGHDPGWIYGEITIDSSAQTLGGELNYQFDDATYPIPPGIDVNLDAEGGITTSPELPGALYLRLAAGKTLMIGRAVGWEDDGENKHQLFQLVKGASGATPTDMAGDWHVTSFYDTQTSVDPGTTQGTLTINAAGTEVTGGLLDDSDGGKLHVIGGDVGAPNSEGYVEISDLSYEGTGIYSTVFLDLSADRDVLFGTAEDNDEYSSLVVAMKLPEPGAGLLGWAALMALAGLRQRPWARR